MRIVSFELAHLARTDPPALSAGEVATFGALCRTPPGPAFSAVDDAGRVLGCAGVVIAGEVGYAWAFLSEDLRDRPMVLHRAVKRGLRKIEADYQLTGLRAAADEKFLPARRWLERLGFHELSTAADRNGGGKTSVRYAR